MKPKTASDDRADCSTPEPGGMVQTDWIPLDPETDRGEHGLTPLILHRLSHKVAGKQVTIAQMLTQCLLDRALDGHFGALEEILIRIDGDAKTSDPAAKSLTTSFEIDTDRAQRILDALHGKREGPPGD